MQAKKGLQAFHSINDFERKYFPKSLKQTKDQRSKENTIRDPNDFAQKIIKTSIAKLEKELHIR